MAAALAYSEGAWSADDPAASTSTPSSEVSPVASGSSATTNAASEIVASDGTPESTTVTPPSTTAAPTTTADTTRPDDGTTASGYADGVHSGTAEWTEWGDVQVQVTIADGAIVDVEAIQYPTGRRSSAINDEAIPILEADAIAMQSADLDVVSGATYTSWTYATSLQAALDRAAVAGQASDSA